MVTIGRQRQLLERRHFGGDGAEGGADAGVLAVDVDAKAPALGGHIGEVQIAAVGEMLGLGARQDLGDIAFQLHRPQVAELDGQQIAMHAQHRRDAHRQVHVRAALLHAEFQERVDARHSRPLRLAK